MTPPLIVRRQRADGPSPSGDGGGARVQPAIPIGPVTEAVGSAAVGTAVATGVAAVSVEALESEEEQHLAAVGETDAVDAALESSERIWELPELGLLSEAPASSAAQMDLTAKGKRIQETLQHFGIGVKVARIQEGPVVTQYALDVEPGSSCRGSRAWPTTWRWAWRRARIRIEAPIPGEPYVGIEIPNSAFDLVTLKEVLGSANFNAMGVDQQAGLRAWARTWPASRSAPTWPRCRTC